MKILALELSSTQRTVALMVDGRVCAVASQTGGSMSAALALVEDAFQQAQLSRDEIEIIGVGLGPGSYTGIRAAIALAQGWQLGSPVRLLGIGSATCLAAQAQSLGWFGVVNIAFDAQRDDVFVGRYEITQDRVRELQPLTLQRVDQLKAGVRAGEWLIGPEVTRWIETGRLLFPEATTLGRLAAGRTDFVAGEELEPQYLRQMTFARAPGDRERPA